MVGIKFDKNKIEKPNTIVIEVLTIATPTVGVTISYSFIIIFFFYFLYSSLNLYI